jgi:hypothetical protein
MRYQELLEVLTPKDLAYYIGLRNLRTLEHNAQVRQAEQQQNIK